MSIPRLLARTGSIIFHPDYIQIKDMHFRCDGCATTTECALRAIIYELEFALKKHTERIDVIDDDAWFDESILRTGDPE